MHLFTQLLRNREVMLQTKDLKWKKKRKYGYKWIAEETAAAAAAFSPIKKEDDW